MVATRLDDTTMVSGGLYRGADGRQAMLTVAARNLRIALQPIVDAHTGVVHAVEALMRGYEGLGCTAPTDVLDHFADSGSIVAFEALLHRLAVTSFAASALGCSDQAVRLFLNIDGRALTQCGDGLLRGGVALLAAAGLPSSSLCWELSERNAPRSAALDQVLHRLRSTGVRLAADDFGQGHSELRLLFDHSVDYVKIDKYFIAGIADGERRKLFVANVCRFAHMLGMRVVAEGVETAEEFLTCRQLGCDLIQGYFVARPQLDGQAVQMVYPHVAQTAHREQRQRTSLPRTEETLRAAMVRAPHLRDTASVGAAFEVFRNAPEADICVVVDASGEPRGTIAEMVLRPYAYNPYGRDLLRNKTFMQPLTAFMQPCPCADVGQRVVTVLDIFMSQPGASGVIVTEGGRYIGLLSAPALLMMANERRMIDALDRNPLTRLPGNVVVADRLLSMVGGPEDLTAPMRHLCYFDFDNFKPFNDFKGFRQGDRAIILFAEAMQRRFPDRPGSLFGHLGGDDFVGVFEDSEPTSLRRALREGLAEFADTVAGLYTEEERAQGWFECLDRYSTFRRFPLLRCSVAVVEFAAGEPPAGAAALDALIARLKSAAKASTGGMAWARGGLPIDVAGD